MKHITFVTGNKFKFDVARRVLEGTEIDLIQRNMETPEIQSTKVTEVASFSARFAAESLKAPVAVTDAGYYIEALNGFPGPFIKYINEWLNSDDLLKLMKGKENRKVTVKACLAYCEPGDEPVTFESEVTGTLAEVAVKLGKEGIRSINEIFIPDGYDKVDCEIPREEMIKFWSEVETYWLKLAEYLEGK